MTTYSVVDVGEVESRGPGGTVRMVRKALGARAFGFNWFEFPPNHEGHEHDERGTGHEEVFVCLEGSGHLRVGGEQVALTKGRFVRLDPEVTRCPVSGPDGMTFLVVGAPLDGRYEPPVWG